MTVPKEHRSKPVNDPIFGVGGYTIKQAAQGTGYSIDTIRREIRAGRLKAYKLEGGREYRIRGSVLNAFIAALEGEGE